MCSCHPISPTLKAMLYTQFFLFFQYCTEIKNNSVHCCRNVRKITIDTPTPYNGVCEQVTTQPWHLSHLFKIPSPTQSQIKIVGTLPLNAVFLLLASVSSSSQCCLSWLTHQILHINIGRVKKTVKCPNNFD